MKTKLTLFSLSLLLVGVLSAQTLVPQLNAPFGKNIAKTGGNVLEFIPNHGQFADVKGIVRNDILYLCRAGHMQVYLRQNGLSYVINTLTNPKLKPGYVDDDPPGSEVFDSHMHLLKLRDEPFKTCRVDMDFVGALIPTLQNYYPADGKLNYYFPQNPNGITGVKPYHNVVYKNIYRDIDVSFKGTYNEGFKYDLIINPGGNPNKIRMNYQGTEKVEILDGKLVFTAFTGQMEEHIPKIYQVINGTEVTVDGKYVIYHTGKDSADGTIVGIEVGKYNLSYPLVIDPYWVTYCGGTTDDEGYACALDNLNNTLVTGYTESTNFPVSVGAFQTSLVGGMDCFVIKFDPNGNRLWATYYGGSTSQAAYGIAADANNNVAITGNTTSPDFPVSGGAFQTTYGGGSTYGDAFVVKFDPNGNRLWATYCGGSLDETGNAIIFDNSGNLAITGSTESSNFPVSAGAFQTTFAGSGGNVIIDGYSNGLMGWMNGDAYVEKFDPNGNRLWGTYLGGSRSDGGFGISADRNGNIVVGGMTYSLDFPIANAFQTRPDSGFVTEFDPTGIFLWSTYYGGQVNGCCTDKSNNVIISGFVGDMSSTPGVYETTYTTGAGFAAKFNSTGREIWATFNNTHTSEGGDFAMAVDDANNIYLEDDEEPPSYVGPSCAFERHKKNSEECLYVVKLDSNALYACSTYLSGTVYDEHEYACANLAAKNGRLAITGFTSGGIPTTPGAFQTVFPGGAYAPYVMNICSFACGDTTPPNLTLSGIIAKSDSCLGYVSFTAHGTASCDSEGAVFQWSFPGGSPSSAIGPYISNVLYTNPGTYTVTVKFIACSVDSLSQTITIVSGFHDSLAIVNPANCHQKGQATVYPSDGVSPYTYSWSNGGTNQSDTGLGAGSYTCVVTSNNGCHDTLTLRIKNPVSPPFITKPLNDTGFCVGGSVALLVSAGSSFTWAPSATLSCTSCANPVATPTTTTVYTVTGMDSVGCPDSAKITVSVDSFPHFSITRIPTGCGGYTELEGIPATSSNDYVWTWAPNSNIIYNVGNVVEVTPSVQTTYSATLSNGFCSITDTITVAPVSNTFPLSIKAIPDTVCQGAVVSLSAVSTSTMISWYWYQPTGLSCNSCYDPMLNTADITVVGSTYTIAVESIDSGDCIAYDTITIHITSDHTGVASTKICYGSSTTLTAPTSNTYLWNTGATTSSITVTPTVTTVYYAIIDSAGCTDSVFHPVIIDTGPAISISTPKDTVCPGSSTSIIALGSNAITWSWLPASGLSCYTCHNPIATVDSNITYTVTATDSAGCVNTDSITLHIIPNHSFSHQNFVCKGSFVTLSASDGNSYLWSNGATTSSISVSPADTTTYYVIVSYNGGCSDTIYQTVNVHTGPAISVAIVPDSICIGASTSLSANSSETGTWNWTPATDLSCNSCPNPTASPTVTTVYIVTATDTFGCATPDSVTVKVIPLPVPTITALPDTVCPHDSDMLIGGGGGTYLWSTSQTSDSIYVFPSSATTYILTVTKNGCTNSVTKTIQTYIPGTSGISLSKDSICPGDTTVITVTGSNTYLWSNGATTSSITIHPYNNTTYTVITLGRCFDDTLLKTVHIIPPPVAVISGNLSACKGKNDTLKGSGGTTFLWSTGSTKTTTYINITKDTTVTLRVFNGECYGDTNVRLTVLPSPTVTITSPPPICPGDSVTLSATGGGSYLWSTGSIDSTITVSPPVSTTYIVIVKNRYDCITSKSTEVTVTPPQLFACCDTSIISGANVTLYADSALSYKWYPATGISCDTCSRVVVNPTVTTTYTVIGTDKSGCIVARIITVTIEPPCVNFFVPNVFTPNSNGVNDQFEIKASGVESYSIIIYDRWGKEMYRSSNPDVYWDGNTEGGAPAPDGVYYYIINTVCNNISNKKAGFVQLIR